MMNRFISDDQIYGIDLQYDSEQHAKEGLEELARQLSEHGIGTGMQKVLGPGSRCRIGLVKE